MGNIVLLDDLTINQIAAGEVIERPASAVKELVENSIDAGANNISIEIRNGGISYIRITDNGKGILPDDMEIAFERHATSKIRKAEDLETVKSMGFRGEALASIAAISRVEMQSKTEESATGYKIIVEGGKIISKEECGCPKGTTITIQNLFYNTPVRYKFLRKDFTEFGYIEDVITRIALINPNISIKLINSGKTVIQTSGNNDMKAILYNIYGRDISQNCLEVDYTYEDIKVTGVVGKPIIARSNRSNQMFFVNKRFVKDKTLSSAAEQAFKGMLTFGKYGFLVLNVDVDMHKVDVNVHPAKLEVRFEEESKIFKAIYHAIKETLLKENIKGEDEIVHYKNESNINFNKPTSNIKPINQIQNLAVKAENAVSVQNNSEKSILNGEAEKSVLNSESEKRILNPEIELKNKLANLEKLVNLENISNTSEKEINLNEKPINEEKTEKKFDIIEEIRKMQAGIYNYENDPEYKTTDDENKQLNKDIESKGNNEIIKNAENEVKKDNLDVNDSIIKNEEKNNIELNKEQSSQNEFDISNENS